MGSFFTSTASKNGSQHSQRSCFTRAKFADEKLVSSGAQKPKLSWERMRSPNDPCWHLLFCHIWSLKRLSLTNIRLYIHRSELISSGPMTTSISCNSISNSTARSNMVKHGSCVNPPCLSVLLAGLFEEAEPW